MKLILGFFDLTDELILLGFSLLNVIGGIINSLLTNTQYKKVFALLMKGIVFYIIVNK